MRRERGTYLLQPMEQPRTVTMRRDKMPPQMISQAQSGRLILSTSTPLSNNRIFKGNLALLMI
jgi:hypothetical protein